MAEGFLERWIDAFRGPLTGLLASWGSDWRAAEELAQDVFAEAWLSRERFRGDPEDLEAAGAWLRGIAARLDHVEWRRSARRPEPLDDAPAPVTEQDPRREELVQAFARLSSPHQTVLR